MQKVILFVLILFVAACKSPYQQTSGHRNIEDEALVKKPPVEKEFLYPVNEVSVGIKKLLAQEYNSDKALQSLYQTNGNKPLWITDKLKKQAFIQLYSSVFHGFTSNDFRILSLKDKYSQLVADSVFSAPKNAEFDVELSQNFIKFLKYIKWGKGFVNEATDALTDSLIVEAICLDDLPGLIESICPKQRYYMKLVEENKYWHNAPDFTNSKLRCPKQLVQAGDSGIMVLAIKERLSRKGFLKQDSLTAMFDSTMEQAVKRFQRKHGLNPDGKPGKQTIKFLNWGKQNYIDALCVNMERMRQENSKIPDNFISVNIPEYKMRLYLDGKKQMENRVIVGKYKNQTPLLTSYINYLVFNPCWTVPNSITVKSILPRIKKDSTYLDRRNMFLGKNGVEINSKDIDFSIYSKGNFPYKVYQRTGNGNALGKVKFMFNNSYSIYLHDTPSQRLFAKDYRAQSHGCVRVQDAMELAKTLLYIYDNQQQRVEYYLKKGYPEKVYLKKPIYLRIEYFTCAYNSEIKMVQFFNDVYAKDYKVLVDL